MLIPILMLVLLVLPWAAASARGQPAAQQERAGRFGIMTMFMFTGLGHFTSTAAIAALIPPTVPWPVPIVYVTGLLEIILGLAVTVPKRQAMAGRALISLLLAFIPINVYGAIYHVPSGGHEWGTAYLLVRIPLQLIIVAWVYRFTLQSSSAAAS